jgi:hypothetical protein
MDEKSAAAPLMAHKKSINKRLSSVVFARQKQTVGAVKNYLWSSVKPTDCFGSGKKPLAQFRLDDIYGKVNDSLRTCASEDLTDSSFSQGICRESVCRIGPMRLK